MSRSVMATLWLSIAASPLAAAVPEARQITSIEGITEYRLDNGLKVLLFPDPTRPKVTVNLTVFVGSRHEGYGETGMAHLLEHMVFKGTRKHPHIPRALSSRGARFNGTTWVDRTNYYETLPASDDNLEFAIRLEADRMVNSLIKAEDLASEMTVVRNEFESGENSARNILSQRMTAVAFEWHNYGKSTIGNRADIERVPIENLRAFYRLYYQPDNAMLIVAGRFKPATALDFIRKYFGSLPRPKRKLRNTYTEEPAQDGERFVTLRRVGDVAMVGASYHVCAGPHPDFPAVAVLEDILTNAPAGRLYQKLVKTKKAARVYGSAFPWHDPGLVELLAEVSKGNDPRLVLDALLEAVDEVASGGVTPREVERSRLRILKQRELAQADTSRIALNLSDWASQSDWRLYFVYRDRIEKVTAANVSRVARQYLKPSNRTVGMFIPQKAPRRVTVPATPDIAKMIGNYKGRATVVAGEAFDVDPLAIEARTKRTTLPGGTKAALLYKKTRGAAVTLELTLRYGDQTNLRGLTQAAEMLPALMSRGTHKFNRQQLQDELNRLQATLSASGSVGAAKFTVRTKRENLPAVTSLLTQVLRDSSLPESELELLKNRQIAQLQQQLSNPQLLAVTQVRRTLDPYPKNDPRYVATIPEQIELTRAVSRKQIKQLYDRYVSSQHSVLTVVGDFDSKQVLPILSEAFSGWEASVKYQRLSRDSKNVKGRQFEINTPDKASAMYFAGMTLPIRDDSPDYPALVLGNYILGGGSLSSRLGDRVRQKDGLSYGVASMLQASSLDRRAIFYIYAICNPKNMPRLKKAIREELNRLLAKGVTGQELANAKTGVLRSREVAFASDNRLASVLSGTITAGRTMQHYADMKKKINAVTTAQVLQTLRKYISPDKLVSAAAGDFSQLEKK